MLTAVTLGSGTTAAGLSENATDDKELFVFRPLYTCKENNLYCLILEMQTAHSQCNIISQQELLKEESI